MVIRQVLLVGNPLLREKSKTVTDFGSELQPTFEDLRDTLTNPQKITGSGRGIAMREEWEKRYRTLGIGM